MDGLEFYYAADGKFFGQGKDKESQKVFTADAQNKDGTFSNVQELSVTHTQFTKIAGIISKEDASTFTSAAATTQATFNAVKLVKGENTSMSDQSKYATELLESSYSSVPNKAALQTTDASTVANNSRAGVIHVLNGGMDYSKGAVLWDGVDFAIKGNTHPKGRDGGFSISDALWVDFTSRYNWCGNKEKGIKYNKKYYPNMPGLEFTNGTFDKPATGKYSKGRVALQAASVHGQHMFWAPNTTDARNKGYDFKQLVKSFFKNDEKK